MKDACSWCDGATVSFCASEVLTSLSTAPGTGTAEPKEIVIFHTAKCKTSALSYSPAG